MVTPDLRDTSLASVLQIAPLAAWAGDRATAMRADARLAAQPTAYYKGTWPYQRARIAAALGDRGRAVALLREAQRQGLPIHTSWHSSAELRRLKGDLGFDALVRLR